MTVSASAAPRFTKRYRQVTEAKAGGSTYTPKLLADFVAQQIVVAADTIVTKKSIRILDPAAGDGELLVSLVRELSPDQDIELHAFDVHESALLVAEQRVLEIKPRAKFVRHHRDFLQHVTENYDSPSLFSKTGLGQPYDLIIANPPYVRTQIMGAEIARALAQKFGLEGRVDLYHAFLIALSRVLSPNGVAGIIVSNRFMTTRAGSSVRAAIHEGFNLLHVWDLGDTKLFEAAVLPAVLLLSGKDGETNFPSEIRFTSIYETSAQEEHESENPIAALAHEGVVRIADERCFEVLHGCLASQRGDVWRLSSEKSDNWLETVRINTWRTFGDIGKIRVGVKTCADKVFIRDDWGDLDRRPELLRPLTTHHIARRFRSSASKSEILYPHEVHDGKRQAVSLLRYPNSLSYLEQHKTTLQNRKYVIEAGRHWYEIWVPQDPEAWSHLKLIFRDISEKPTFWIDEEGTVVNGDCYWMISEKADDDEQLWLAAAVANSTFAEAFYDRKFNNKLYAGRRRFITQYVEQFPLPDPSTKLSKRIIANAKAIYSDIGTAKSDALELETDALIWRSFGLS